ncbi:MAG: alkaline phosphatase family protein [Anaerolineae bacterium]|nr:alkaline phosphatase family protein [Anaerolineae bacterium]
MEQIWPQYEGKSLVNLPATMAAILGAEIEGAPPLEPSLWKNLAQGAERIVTILIDAVGYLDLRKLMDRDEEFIFARLARKGLFSSLTSVFPSATVAALASFWTARPPIEHGLTGYTLYFKEFGVVANTLTLSPARHEKGDSLEKWGLDPEKLIPVPSFPQLLKPFGIKVAVLIHREYVKSPFSRALHREIAEIRGFFTTSEMWILLRRLLRELSGEKAIISVYWGFMDALGHLYGPDDEIREAELRNLALSMEQDFLKGLEPEDKKGTLLVIFSDHGQISAKPEKAIMAMKHPELWDSLVLPPAGESRASYLYIRDGERERVKAYLEEKIGSFTVVDSREAVEKGLFGRGNPAPDFLSRIGDLIAIARGEEHLVWGYEEPKLKGRHGGLSPQEMLIPLLMVRLDS